MKTQRRARRFSTTNDIYSEIARLRRKVEAHRMESEVQYRIASSMYKQGPHFKPIADFHKLKSERASRAATAIETRRIPALKEKIAEIETPMLFPGMDTSIPARTTPRHD